MLIMWNPSGDGELFGGHPGKHHVAVGIVFFVEAHGTTSHTDVVIVDYVPFGFGVFSAVSPYFIEAYLAA